MFFGVDYYPEYWDERNIDSDITRMLEMGVNVVRIGEFSWHLMEKSEGEYDFSFFDKVIGKLRENSIKVIFGTPTATFPGWLAEKNGSAILSVDGDGIQRSFGGRRVYCFNSEVYRNYCRGIVSRLVSHYRNEEVIIAWQVDNEPGHENSDICFCDTCVMEFRKFLENKYGTIQKLNEAYGTIFWGQTYNSFSEVPAPKRTITQHNPSLQLDYARFRSESLVGFMREQVEMVHRCKGAHQQTTINLPGGFFDKWFDFEKAGVLGDFISYDNYPVWGGLREPIPPAEIAMGLDFVRGLSYGIGSVHGAADPLKKDPSGISVQGSFWIIEQLMGAQGHEIIGYKPRPGQAAMWSWQGFGRGCSNMLYFSWRSMTRGTEQFCHGLMGHDNQPTEVALEAKMVMDRKKSLDEKCLCIKLDENIGRTTEVAVLYDYENVWSWRIQPQSSGFNFKNELLRLYRPFYSMNAGTDLFPAERDFSGYKVVILPVMQFISDELAARLKVFTKEGGTVIFSFRTGLRDENNNIREMTLPGNVADLCGIRIRSYEALQKGEEVEIKGAGTMKGYSGTGQVWRDFIEVDTAETLYTYRDQFYRGYSCITKNTYGAGKAYYIGAGVDEMTMKLVAEKAALESGIRTIKSEDGVEVLPKNCEGREILFCMNHTPENKTFKGRQLGPYEYTCF